MNAPKKADPVVVAGYAVGIGAVFVATLGVYWRFWQPGTSAVVWGGGSFLLGALLGGAWAWWRKVTR